jgi:hypothetical protein
MGRTEIEDGEGRRGRVTERERGSVRERERKRAREKRKQYYIRVNSENISFFVISLCRGI